MSLLRKVVLFALTQVSTEAFKKLGEQIGNSAGAHLVKVIKEKKS